MTNVRQAVLERSAEVYVERGRFCPYLSMPSRLIFDSSVCRGIPSFAAAPEGPADAAMALGESRFDHLHFTICQRREPFVRPLQTPPIRV